LFALLSQFARICRNFHYVFITVQPEEARLKVKAGVGGL
jgi:hypothetical protein